MKRAIKLEDVKEYVENNIGKFHSNRLASLKELKLDNILKRKNPYLFKAKNVQIAGDLVKTILDAYLSSQEEGVFGSFLEGLAIFVNEKAYGGKKSSGVGIDLEFDKDNKRYIVAIKSGPNWGNSQQIAKMKDNFRQARRILRTSGSSLEVIAVNGCCYGKNKNTDQGDYFKVCGQEFWELISGEKDLYIRIIEPLGHKAKEKNEEFMAQYSKIVNIFTEQFNSQFCKQGMIDWEKLVKFNSSNEK